jgi:hypothetical protein
MSLVFKDPLFDGQWLRAAGHGRYGGAEVGECFAAARRIKELDAQSWFDAWYSLAETVLAEANKSRAAGRPVSALGGYCAHRTTFGQRTHFYSKRRSILDWSMPTGGTVPRLRMPSI